MLTRSLHQTTKIVSKRHLIKIPQSILLKRDHLTVTDFELDEAKNLTLIFDDSIHRAESVVLESGEKRIRFDIEKGNDNEPGPLVYAIAIGLFTFIVYKAYEFIDRPF